MLGNLQIIVLLVAVASGDIITPPDCQVGPNQAADGYASNIVVSVNDLSGNPPYTLSVGVDYTFTATFTAPTNSAGGVILVSGGFLDVIAGTLDPQIIVASAPLGSWNAGENTTASVTFQVPAAFKGKTLVFVGLVNDDSKIERVCKRGIIKIAAA